MVIKVSSLTFRRRSKKIVEGLEIGRNVCDNLAALLRNFYADNLIHLLISTFL